MRSSARLTVGIFALCIAVVGCKSSNKDEMTKRDYDRTMMKLSDVEHRDEFAKQIDQLRATVDLADKRTAQKDLAEATAQLKQAQAGQSAALEASQKQLAAAQAEAEKARAESAKARVEAEKAAADARSLQKQLQDAKAAAAAAAAPTTNSLNK